MIELVRKSLKAFQEGGFGLFAKRFVTYLKLRISPPFHPRFPPIGVRYKRNRLTVGYKDRYIHIGNRYKIIPKSTDTVVEAGVHDGIDTATFAKLANHVVGFEPSPRNYSKAKNNLGKFDNIELVNQGLWCEEDQLTMKYGKSEGDDGFLEPDKGTAEEIGTIPTNTLENCIRELGIEQIDFLKVEAEGAEPEIIQGLGELRPRNIVVNAGEERNGDPVGKDVMKLLQPIGYRLVAIKYANVLFFIHEDYEDIPHDAFREEFVE